MSTHIHVHLHDNAPALRACAGVACRTPDGAYLFVRRTAGHGKSGGLWEFPGGHVEDGESNEQGAARETEEEVGLPVDPERLTRLTTRSSIDEHVVYTTFLHKVPQRFKPRLSWEHDDYRWATAANAPTPRHPGVDYALAEA